MNKYEYFWAILHKEYEMDKELQSSDFFALMGKISKLLYEGWTVTYLKLMNGSIPEPKEGD